MPRVSSNGEQAPALHHPVEAGGVQVHFPSALSKIEGFHQLGRSLHELKSAPTTHLSQRPNTLRQLAAEFVVEIFEEDELASAPDGVGGFDGEGRDEALAVGGEVKVDDGGEKGEFGYARGGPEAWLFGRQGVLCCLVRSDHNVVVG